MALRLPESVSRIWHRLTYRQVMAADDVSRVEPVRRLAELDRWVGLWVAVKDERVVAAAPTSRDLVRKVIEMGPSARGAVAQFVPEPSEAIVIGMG
ncbi:MAG: hypothetical protein QOE45_3218 [Frankiaceae bacterium]|jgi:hypothetical protein|nr:hypothetical protein [Frankiaceae bacterium]